MRLLLILLLAGFINPAFAATTGSSLHSTAITIPNGEGGIGFDDMTFSSGLHKVLIPAGHTGKLYLIDPSTYAMTVIGGFSSSTKFQKGHDAGITSADEGGGFLFVLDHGKKEIVVIDPKTAAVAARAPLAGDSDYVRYVEYPISQRKSYLKHKEIWVTEPHNKQIEVFKFSADPLSLSLVVRIPVPDGPESLMVDHQRNKAYTNFGRQAGAIDLASHAIVATWPNGCEKSRGDALDESKGFLFVSCAEGKAVVFDIHQGHQEISNLTTDPGADVISYNTKLSHLYLTSSNKASLSVLGVSAQGKLSLLAHAQADQRAHCVVSDDQDNIWVCDPPRGQVLRFKDSF